jgi:hypothetical protein
MSNEMFSDILKRAKSVIESHTLEKALTNEHNPIFSMFLLKNHFNYSDKTEVTHNVSNNATLDNLSVEDLRALLNENDEKNGNNVIEVNDYEEVK